MKEVKAGEIIVIGEEKFKVPEESVQAINIWLECFESGISDEGTVEIPLLATNGTGYGYFMPSVIAKALQQEI